MVLLNTISEFALQYGGLSIACLDETTVSYQILCRRIRLSNMIHSHSRSHIVCICDSFCFAFLIWCIFYCADYSYSIALIVFWDTTDSIVFSDRISARIEIQHVTQTLLFLLFDTYHNECAQWVTSLWLFMGYTYSLRDKGFAISLLSLKKRICCKC